MKKIFAYFNICWNIPSDDMHRPSLAHTLHYDSLIILIHPYISPSIHLFIHLFIYSFIHLFIYSFIHLFIYSFIHLFIYSFIHLFIH